MKRFKTRGVEAGVPVDRHDAVAKAELIHTELITAELIAADDLAAGFPVRPAMTRLTSAP